MAGRWVLESSVLCRQAHAKQVCCVCVAKESFAAGGVALLDDALHLLLGCSGCPLGCSSALVKVGLQERAVSV